MARTRTVRATIITMDQDDFIKLIWDHYRRHGRDLPWRRTNDPYAIVVSELMLQQTQVSRVGPYYERFLVQFPDWQSLAAASLAEVITAWQGLGYNRRALYLKRLAKAVVTEHKGSLPTDPAQLVSLPGIGPGTAGSIAAFAFNRPVVFIETNIRRAYLHHFLGDRTDVSDAELRPIIEATLDRHNPREWYYALMDYGSALAGTTPNPNRRSRHYTRQSRFEGSDRQLRGMVLRALASGGWIGRQRLVELTGSTTERLRPILAGLVAEGFLERGRRGYRLVQ